MSRLLVVAPNWLGDAVLALPAVADVRRASSGSTIAVSGPPAVASLFQMVPDVDEILDARAARAAEGSFDAVLLLPNSFRSALDAARARIPERWGYRAGGRGWLLTRSVARPAGLHQVDYYRHLVRALGFPNHGAEPRLEVPADCRAAAARALHEAGWDGVAPLVALAPGAAYGAAKRWPPEYFADLVGDFATGGVRSVIVGSLADRPVAREIERHLGSGRASLIDLVGTNVETLAGTLTFVRALVANDSGAMHLGAAIGVPVTAVFGPTDQRRTSPRSTAPHAVLSHPVWCRPCMLRDCPLDHRCLRGISWQEVADATRRLW